MNERTSVSRDGIVRHHSEQGVCSRIGTVEKRRDGYWNWRGNHGEKGVSFARYFAVDELLHAAQERGQITRPAT